MAALKVTTERAHAEGALSRWQGSRKRDMNSDRYGPAGATALRAESPKD
jgi:hypothetical protein